MKIPSGGGMNVLSSAGGGDEHHELIMVRMNMCQVQYDAGTHHAENEVRSSPGSYSICKDQDEQIKHKITHQAT